jgi:hypothetical protein
MQRNLVRALLLAMTMLIVGALPALAQSDEGWMLTSEDDSVLVGVQRDVAIPAGETADGIISVDGQVLVDGAVDNLFAVDSDVVIRGPSGQVEKVFTIGGTLTLEDGATVNDGWYIETELSVAPTATVTGEIVNAQDEIVGAFAAVIAIILILLLFVLIGAFIAMLAMTLLVMAFGTRQVRRAAATISNDVLKTIVVGLLMLVIPNLLFGLLIATIVGIPLALAMMAVWGLIVFLGWIVVGVWIGERILPRARTANRPYGAAFLGVLILLLLSWTGIVPLLATLFGTGAVTLAGWRVLRDSGTPPVPPGYGEPYGQPMQAPPPAYAPPPYAPPPYAPPPQQGQPQQGQPQQGQPQQGQWPQQDGQPPNTWPQS